MSRLTISPPKVDTMFYMVHNNNGAFMCELFVKSITYKRRYEKWKHFEFVIISSFT